jgi:hypothetical protein
MAEHTLIKRCSHEGCTEWSPSSYSNRRDYNEAYTRYSKNGWKCSKHINPEEVLSLDRLTIVDEQTVTGDYWNDSHGFTHGHGFKAWAGDFPKGTILRVTAQIIIPE